MADTTNGASLMQLSEVTPPSVEAALKALQLWQSLERIYAPVRALSTPQNLIGFSINSSPMLKTTPNR